MEFTAALVVDRFLEVYSSKSKRRHDDLMDCVDSAHLSLNTLADESAPLSASSFLSDLEKPVEHKAEASKRIFIESSNKRDPSFALDFYQPNRAPFFTSSIAPARACVALYLVKGNKIRKVRTHAIIRE